MGGVGGWLRITLIIRLSQPQAGDWAWAWAELGKNSEGQLKLKWTLSPNKKKFVYGAF